MKKNVKEPDPDASVDWARYTTVEDSLKQAGQITGLVHWRWWSRADWGFP